MGKAIVRAIQWIAAIYSVGYMMFDYPNDTYMMRAITAIMTTIFSFTLLMYVLNWIERKVK